MMIGNRVMALLLIPFLLISSVPVVAAETEERIWEDEWMYSIMIDRFNNGDPTNDQGIDIHNPNGYHGGDVKGIIDKLDYIQDMGVTAIVLSPLFKSSTYDGSGVQDFYKMDERYGTMEQLKQLIKEAHDRDMKVVLRFVASDNDQETLKAAVWWMDQVDIDGYKISSLEEKSPSFWKAFVNQVKAHSPEFYLIGSAPEGSDGTLYEKAGFDLIIDYSLYEQISDVFSKINSSSKGLYERWGQTVSSYENAFTVGTMIDDEDTVRFTRKALENRHHPGTRTKLALTYLFSAPGIPTIYYGTEIALDGGEEPDNNRSMNFRVEKELIDYISKISEIRAQMPSLRKGTFELIYEKDGIMVYKRGYKNETTVVAINNTDETQIVDIPVEQMGREKELRGLLEEDMIRSTGDGYRIAIDREKANIYVLGDKTGLNVKFIAAMVIVYGTFMIFIYLVWKRGKKKQAS
ncbi:alpha-amylase family glycosyl hydrolase [Priestia abyssalis]|uniref:alpha-amylase family glycosyl hydrolase n=1 Tax=Priestia abyssalis TaxID=1221450 RepID=UPI001EECCA1D|nr:alpha-amylase family glycosyl hydrolase [Priestia abyssalis]